jgi:hypothetical protein
MGRGDFRLWHKADITNGADDVSPLSEVKRTLRRHSPMSAYDLKRTLVSSTLAQEDISGGIRNAGKVASMVARTLQDPAMGVEPLHSVDICERPAARVVHDVELKPGNVICSRAGRVAEGIAAIWPHFQMKIVIQLYQGQPRLSAVSGGWSRASCRHRGQWRHRSCALGMLECYGAFVGTELDDDQTRTTSASF